MKQIILLNFARPCSLAQLRAMAMLIEPYTERDLDLHQTIVPVSVPTYCHVKEYVDRIIMRHPVIQHLREYDPTQVLYNPPALPSLNIVLTVTLMRELPQHKIFAVRFIPKELSEPRSFAVFEIIDLASLAWGVEV